MNSSPRHRSITGRLAWMNVLVSGIALLLAYISFLAYDLLAYRQAAVNNLLGEAQIIGANSVSAILFNDEISAHTTLSALSSSGDVTAAAIYMDSDARFAQYVREGAAPLQPRQIPRGALHANWVDGVDIQTGSSIVFQGKVVGKVYIQAHLNGLGKQAVRYASIAGGILLLCLGVALLVGVGFRRLLAQPIVSIAQTARLVTRYRDYSLRFSPSQSYEELALLTEAFNEMLAEIQERDAALEQAKVDLERRVEGRTEELQTANRELEAFSYTVAHDLRGPLQAISNLCYLLKEPEQEEGSRQQVSMPAQLRASVNKMSNMIDDLLDLSRSTSAALYKTQLDLSLLARSNLAELAETYPDRHVETFVHPGCFTHADPGLMQVVLQNLLRNAWKFTARSQPAQIEFGCKGRGTAVVFFVRDNGAGFDPGLADRLFKPFQRLHAASEFPGTGIGLATVQRIIHRHGGKIWAESELDKGATFYFTLGPTQT
jgi:signal transduction histidine kinase